MVKCVLHPFGAVKTGLGLAFFCFALWPIYSAIGIVELHKGWNWFYQFLIMLAIALATRLVFLWIMGTEARALDKLERKT